MGIGIEFDYMRGDSVMSHVKIGKKLLFENYSKDPMDCPFGDSVLVTKEDLEYFYKSRCFNKSRPDCKELLKSLGLNSYSPFEIICITHGILIKDDYWIRFSWDGNMSYSEAKSLLKVPW